MYPPSVSRFAFESALTIVDPAIFSQVKKSPKFIPLLVYLHPPPTQPLVPSQADYWTQSLIDFYPKGLKNGTIFLPSIFRILRAECEL